MTPPDHDPRGGGGAVKPAALLTCLSCVIASLAAAVTDPAQAQTFYAGSHAAGAFDMAPSFSEDSLSPSERTIEGAASENSLFLQAGLEWILF